MSIRVVLLFLAAFLCAAASLTWVKAPSLAAWKIAILVTEYGCWLWPLPIPMILAALSYRTTHPVFCYSIGFCSALTLGLLVKPTYQAMQLARELPRQLAREFGSVDVGRPSFSLRTLFSGEQKTPAVRRETHFFQQLDPGTTLALEYFYAVGRRPAPCVVVIHGGGWDSGDRHQFEAYSLHLARRGFAVAAIDYRLAPAFIWPAQRDDVQGALTYLRQHHGELGLDPDRFVLLGRSAGGQIAEAVGYGQPPSYVRGVISLYAPADLYFAWHYTKENDLLDSFRLMRQYLGGTPETADAAFASASPYGYVNKFGALPTLLVHGQNDALVWHRQSERLSERLKDTKTPVVFLDLPWATHGCDYNPHGPSGQLCSFAIDWFLQAVTR